MKNGLVIADAGPIFSLAILDKLHILTELFAEVKIPNAVWKEITSNDKSPLFETVNEYFMDKIQPISSFNDLTFIMDYGESESVLLYRELNADFLLIDDLKARKIAENFGIKCIGTIAVLSLAKEKNVINKLKPLFEQLLENKRFFSVAILNSILVKYDEPELNLKL